MFKDDTNALKQLLEYLFTFREKYPLQAMTRPE